MVSSIGRRAAMLAALVVCGGMARASAQIFLGRIDVTVVDSSGKALPNARVTVNAPVDASRTSDPGGEAHFQHLAAGSYVVTASLATFANATASGVLVAGGAATRVTLTLRPAAAAQEAASSASSPIVDQGRSTATRRFHPQELQDVPSPRDPWAWLPLVPAVYLDRVNVGGAESGHQSRFIGKGAQPVDTIWSLDGVPVSDMATPGTSSLFLDIDNVAEMAVTTGGADARNATGGVQAQLLLKSGGTAPHGDVHYYFENDHLQTVNISDALALALSAPTGNSNRMDSYHDLGFNLGGPLLQDHVWIWGTVSQTNVSTLTFNDFTDETKTKIYAAKADGVLSNTIRGNFTFFENDRSEDGAGAGAMRTAESAWNEADPARFYKGEARFVLGPSVVATARGSWITRAFTLTPAGGLGASYYIDDSGQAHNSYYQLQTSRPQRYGGGDVSAVLGPHAVDAGFSIRTTPVDNLTTYPADHIVTAWNSYPSMFAQVSRDVQQNTNARYVSGFAQDTFTADRLTVTGGVRFDRQSSSLLAAAVPAVAGFETLLPAMTAAQVNNVYTWTNITPRIAASFLLPDSRTIARASYSMYASQLPGTQAAFASPIQNATVTYAAVDANGDGLAQVGEFQTAQGITRTTGFDPKNPFSTTSINHVGSTHAPMTHEWTAGVDADLPANVSLTGTFTYRRMTDLLWTPLIGVRAAQYTPAGTLSGTLPEIGSYSVPLYALKAGAAPAGGGLESVNRAGYHQGYTGFEIAATKRMSNRWMARFALSTNQWHEFFDDPAASIVDPTKAPSASAFRPFAGPQISGGSVVQVAPGTGQSSVFMVPPKYEIAADGVLSLPFDIGIAGNLTRREGYAEPFYQSNVDTGDALGPKTVMLTPAADTFRLPPVTLLNARLEKRFVFGGATVAVDFDVFNALNADTVLGKQYDARLTGALPFGQVVEIMNPRIARLGFRLVF